MKYRALTDAGDMQFGRSFAQEFLENTPATVAQAVQTSLGLFQGEWFLDNTVGVPWSTQVLGKNTQSIYDQTIQDAILDVQGVQSIDDYQSFLNTATRNLVVSVTINTIYGAVSASGVFGPKPFGFGLLDSTFILDLSVLA